ncbi:hypothetical protein L21SP5_02649 [Salinivirga cyanobacteriivorans]|uniref:DUF4340 domain-containing protein n=1 Tax=Salinivirga cyanobacteriivorans TaxID=1307839 RepID=A0A0S2I204_9BACT|nr:DUF4340 domain-containing protein [Salinivirga cyanobacteriivorans]ALO16272.1 hypothetical protein L21SP5_02649 [Salinivirga cyanobacteriivorans]
MKKYIIQILVIIVLVGLIVAAQLAPYGTSRLFDMLKIGKQATIRELRDFNIEDTAKIDRIFMVDKENNIVELTESEQGKWYVNEEFLAKKNNVQLLLKTLHRMRIKTPVAKAAEENILKSLATKSVKVEVYSDDDLMKTIYIGGVTQNQLGTYALLEGSNRPFVIEIPGFRGYLSSRFTTNPVSWRSTRIFYYDQSQIDEIGVRVGDKPEESFKIYVNGRNEYELYGEGKKAKVFDTLAVRRFVKEFEHKYHSHFVLGKSPKQVDSVFNSSFFYRFSVKLNNDESVELSLHRNKNISPNVTDDDIFTVNQLNGIINRNTWVLVQTHVFATMFKELSDFKPQF